MNVKDTKPIEVIPFTPELIGRQKQVELILGKKNGKATIRYELSRLGVGEISEDDVTKILNDVKEKSIEKKAPLTWEEFLEIVKKYIRIQSTSSFRFTKIFIKRLNFLHNNNNKYIC